MKIKPKKIFNFILTCLFILFLSLYIASENGYYEYKNKERAEFTEEKMKQFEEDIKSGKRVDINDYLTKETQRYDNKVTDFGNKLSDIIDNSMMNAIEKSFSAVDKLIN